MLDDYRSWLESELQLLGNASHHAYSFGQANMAKRAIERLDETLLGRVALLLEAAEAAALLEALEARSGGGGAADEALQGIHARLRAATAPRAS